MKVLVTGAKGFIGRHLVLALNQLTSVEVIEFDHPQTEEQLLEILDEVEFIYHLAGVNRPKDKREFIEGNVNLTQKIISKLIGLNKKTPILITSSIQATLENDYGASKRQAEIIVKEYQKQTHAPIFIYRLTNVFGKWCRPHYNSVIATFCYQIARNQNVWINDPKIELEFIYIDDVINAFVTILSRNLDDEDYFTITPSYTKTLGEIYETLKLFEQSREINYILNLHDPFIKKLYSTYLSYLPSPKFSYPLVNHSDHRGSFAEIFKTDDCGQIAINVTKPGFIKGNHWHHTKVEKFLVVSGQGVIRLREISKDEIIEFFVSDQQLEIVEIPVGYTHHIENIGSTDLITLIWANECFNPHQSDTYYMEV